MTTKRPDIAEIRARLAAATQTFVREIGPSNCYNTTHCVLVGTSTTDDTQRKILCDGIPRGDADLFIHAPADLEALCDRVEDLEAALRDLSVDGCTYGDNCPTFGSRHGTCTACFARAALRATHEEGET